MFSETGEWTRMEEMHGKHHGKQNQNFTEGIEVRDNQDIQRQEELEKQKQEEWERIEAQKREQEERSNQARIEAQKIAQTTEAPSNNPNSEAAKMVNNKLEWALRETFP